jgi:hypothetical protein
MHPRYIAVATLVLSCAARPAQVAQPAPAAPPPPRAPELGFFVTSEGSPAGGDLGGLAGADGWCQRLASAVGAGRRTWRAYLSTSKQVGPSFKPDVNARDRIGKGPWFNRAGALIATDVASLHAGGIAPALILDEKGEHVPRETGGVMVGTRKDGTGYPLRNCYGWTSGRSGVDNTNDFARLGHAAGKTAAEWVDSQGADCNPEHQRTLSSSIGRIYCFAAD